MCILSLFLSEQLTLVLYSVQSSGKCAWTQLCPSYSLYMFLHQRERLLGHIKAFSGETKFIKTNAETQQ